MKTLILTGWGWLDYACAAAVVLRKYQDAEVMGMSVRRLPEFLSSLLDDSDCKYVKIIILGIGLRGNPDSLFDLFQRLKRKKIEVSWFSLYDLPDWIPNELQKVLHVKVNSEKESLTELVAEHFKILCNDLVKLINTTHGKSDNYTLARHLLLKASQYRYRNYQDIQPFHDAVITIAEKRKFLSDEQQKIIDHYKKYGSRELKGKSPAMQRLRGIINKVGPKDSAKVLIYGESGTGKETVAIHIHEKSPRRKGPMITFNCASTSKALLESHLFGHEKGAFTGADSVRHGVFEEADGGTLFLDEIGELSLEIQANILRVLQEGRFTRLGSNKEINVDVRIITATNRNLIQMVKDGTFRDDLFYRLNVIPIHIPPLREHLEDIEDIANNFWFELHKHFLTPEQISILGTYHWPGNIRELINFLEYTDIMGENDFALLLSEHRKRMQPITDNESELPDNLEELTRHHAKILLKKYHGNISQTANAMGVTRNTLKKYLN